MLPGKDRPGSSAGSNQGAQVGVDPPPRVKRKHKAIKKVSAERTRKIQDGVIDFAIEDERSEIKQLIADPHLSGIPK